MKGTFLRYDGLGRFWLEVDDNQINPVLLWKRGTFKRYEDHQTVPPEHRTVWVKIDDHLHPESAWIGHIRPLGLLELISEAARDF